VLDWHGSIVDDLDAVGAWRGRVLDRHTFVNEWRRRRAPGCEPHSDHAVAGFAEPATRLPSAG
jgi:hypothetical protein